MPVENLKFQLEFRMNSEGWSEVYYKAGSDPKAAKPDAVALVNERKKFLAPVGVIHHVRISAAQPGGRSFRFTVANGAGGASALPRDVRNVTTTVQAWGATAGSRVFKFHGRQDDAIVFNDDGTAQAAIPAVIDTFMAYLVTQQYQIRTNTLAANDPALPKVTDIDVAAGEVTFYGTFPGTTVGEKIRISGVKGFKTAQFNRVWTVSEVVAGPPAGIKCQTTALLDPTFLLVKGSGRLREANFGDYTFVTISDYADTVAFSTRKVGRPTDSPRGRR